MMKIRKILKNISVILAAMIVLGITLAVSLHFLGYASYFIENNISVYVLCGVGLLLVVISVVSELMQHKKEDDKQVLHQVQIEIEDVKPAHYSHAELAQLQNQRDNTKDL
ncbi:MAG: hypothetical protein IKB86_03560 [Clostridia bacterium]|nr:hypothetical protein [Clostridia bacterium]